MGGFYSGNPEPTIVGTEDSTENTIDSNAVQETDSTVGFYRGSPVQVTIDAYAADAEAAAGSADSASTTALNAMNQALAAQQAAETAESNAEQAYLNLSTKFFKSPSEPTSNVDEGDTWYDTASENYYVYREIAVNTFKWVPILLGNALDGSDIVDCGGF